MIVFRKKDVSSHTATSFAGVEVGGIGMGGGDHVADSIDNDIIWVGGDVIKELVDGQRGGFSDGCLLDANRADSY